MNSMDTSVTETPVVRLTPFTKVLVANRGEIALRVMRSARALGYATVAVYSSADTHARHVQEAGQSVLIGGPLPAQSYLNIPAIVGAARATGADAVHPGYGFLAENENFAQACRDAGLVFIGPSPEAMASMGDKAAAKRLMMDAGVPCIPGYLGDDQSEARLAREAVRIGYPVMIKATAGGGGRGMRLVHSEAEFVGLLRSAQSEALNAFGDATVLLERAITDPRHIEIQVFADRHGHAIHLGERDCSLQRRHQKIVEEAPSPAVDAALRERMGATAVAACKAIGYEGAGTLEFLLDAQGEFYFMEMNTRLQVEHPVTEAVTGLDLVALQLRVAAGEALPLSQGDVKFYGHAIEVRLCAEDADQSFMPQSGTMARWNVPDGLRVEHALHTGAVVPPYYDSMIAKLVAHGANRDEARRKMLLGLEETVALGITTNQAFLMRCVAHPVFGRGGITTGFIARHLDELLTIDDDTRARAWALAAVLFWRGTQELHPNQGATHRSPHRLPVRQRLKMGGLTRDTTLTHKGVDLFSVQWEGKSLLLETVALNQQEVRFVCNGVGERAAWLGESGDVLLRLRGQSFRVSDCSREAISRQHGAAGDGRLRASMNGRVVAVLAAVGDVVRAGQPLVTLEAMKMEHVHAAPRDGVLVALLVAPGDQVPPGRLLAEIGEAGGPVGPSPA